ncbi:MAG: crotonase/enoyl-CoA hydratase family protein [Pseudomonadota bacterium]
MPEISTRVEGEIIIVAIDRPHRRNAVDLETAKALYAAFQAFDDDDALKVAILTGSGGTFCAGADLQALPSETGGERIVPGGEGDFAPMGPTRLTVSKPVIAAVEGHAVAGGMELALWCDLRVVARDAIFGIYCRRFGVPLVDGGTIRLPRLIGQSRAMDLILTGRPVKAQEAFEIGLANRLCEPGSTLDASIELANGLTKFPQRCMRNDRLSMLDQWSLPLDGALRRETGLGLETVASGETVDGAKRFSGGEGRHGAFD